MHDTVFKCHLAASTSSAQPDLSCVLQGPYNEPPYLPPRDPNSKERFYAITTVADLNIDLGVLGEQGKLKLFFWHHGKKARVARDSARQPTIHVPFVMREAKFKNELSGQVKLVGQEMCNDSSPYIVWGSTRQGHLAWLMLVIEERTLMRLCKHEDQAERLASLPDAELDAAMVQYGGEKVNQIMAVYTRKLQLKLLSDQIRE